MADLKLRVAEAVQDDVNKGIVRIDSTLMKQIGVAQGDIVEIEGKRKTVAIADRSYPGDLGLTIIRMDGITRRNAKASIGEVVSIRKAEVKEAKKITIAPARKGIIVKASPQLFKQGLLGRVAVKGDIVSLGGTRSRRSAMSNNPFFEDMFNVLDENLMGFGFSDLKFVVAQTAPTKVPVIITEETEVTFNPEAIEVREEAALEVNYEDIGGCREEIKKIRELVELPLKHPEIFERLGIEAPKGVLLHGPPGTGKTLLAKAVASETESNFILLNGPEIMSKFYGESEKKIRDIFENAEKNAPSIIFIDELDAIAPKREDVSGEVERRVVSQLLTMMDGLKSRGKVVVIGATNRPNSIDSALRRPGRFDREIEINVPSKDGRLSILKIHTRGMPLTKDVKLEDLAAITHGFVGADLESLAKEAAMVVLRGLLPQMKLDEEEKIPQHLLDKLKIQNSDFLEALKFVRPSAMREVLVETPNIKWDDVGGLEEVKRELREAVEWPIKYQANFKRMGIRPSKGILLYGPPGTGKTLLAKAVAKESEANFIQVKGPSLLSMWVGKSEEGMRKIFERARQVAPCIIFFDEIDSLAGKRGMEQGTKVTERVLNQMLAEMDGIEDVNDILVIGATNRPDMLDPAILRPGRFDKILLVNAPDENGRENILKIHTKNMPIKNKEALIKEIAKKADGYTGADLEALAREAALLSLRENINAEEVHKKHFEEALNKVKPSVTTNTIKVYKKVEEQFLKSAKSATPTQEGSYLG